MKYVLGVAGLVVLIVAIRTYRAFGRIQFSEATYEPPPSDWP